MHFFRKATLEDLDEVWSILESAKELLKSLNIDQWQDGYPNKKLIKTDIKKDRSYLMICEGEIAAVGVILVGVDPAYTAIDGQWMGRENEQNYVSIHRTAISPRFQGKKLSSIMMTGLIEICSEMGFKDIRADTHKDNKTMQHVLAKSGFEYRGEIYQGNESWRQAYQLLLS
ncbi:GNAT family N-acetyltransferase LALA0_S06e07646g [Lachancea lanzarotensis]|uniref:LALA0S06e07646g1_1 n=1 Tax=Lachancea lanzarotensis TaxID=1245769 RepID=A0A0C7MYY0_9SACH|nr:uncharacterized protein LALA0_S06e07646g [Lachancea lanzarotensis]CEP62951.1 LALA0S06e07646g1_1 [Lachancea lanzarotensis]